MNERARDQLSPDSRGGHLSPHSGSPTRRPYPLKSRIKDMMARSSASTTTIDQDSVFDAAKTIASIGLSSPAPFVAPGRERGQASHQSPSELHGGAAPAARSGDSASAETPAHSRIEVPSLIRRPSVLVVALEDRAAAPLRGLAAASLPMPREGSMLEPLPAWVGSDVARTFPQKLMDMLSNPQVFDIVTWLPHGKGFLILQKRRFAAEVMPLYFKHSKFTSFTRKLNRWGFTRVSKGLEMGAYYHKHFQRDDYHLCMQMHCNPMSSQPSSSKASKKDAVAKTRKSGNPARSPSPKFKAATLLQVESHSPSGMSDMPSQEVNENIQSPELNSHSLSPPPNIAYENKSNPTSTSGRESATAAPAPEGMSNASVVECQQREIAPESFDHVFHQQQESLRDSGIRRSYSRQGASQLRGGRSPLFVQSPSLLTQPRTSTGQHSSRHWLRQQWLRQARKQLQQLRQQQKQCLKRQLHYLRQQQRIQQQQQVCPPSQRQRKGEGEIHPQQLQAMALQSLMGVDKTSSSNHPLVIANAMAVAKSLNDSNDQVLLTALMGDNTPAGGGPGRPESSEVQRRARAAMQEEMHWRVEDGIEDDGSLSPRVRNIISADMLAQIRHIHRQDTKWPTGTRPSPKSSSRQTWDTDAILPQMRRPDESNHRRLVGMANKPSRACRQMSQSRITRLHNEIEREIHQEMQQLQRHDGVSGVTSSRSGGVGERPAERRIPRVVRRASAA